MSFSEIPASLLQNPDRKSAFQGIKAWLHDELKQKDVVVDDRIPTGSNAVDNALGGGYSPGKICEIVEPSPSRGVQSLIHHAIVQARQNLQYVALIDAPNQFDPQSEAPENLQSLLWIRTNHQREIVNACDILIRDGNFTLLILDLRLLNGSQKAIIRPNEWYRLQRVCEQTCVAFITLTTQSRVPCADVRIQLRQCIPSHLLDAPPCNPLAHIECDVLKQRTLREASKSRQHGQLKVANSSHQSY